MRWIAGIDGCRGGWLVVRVAFPPAVPLAYAVQVCPRFAEVLALGAGVLAVDIPIGLPSGPGGRCCDRLARRLLGRRASSVFSPPARLLLEATQYAQVRPYGLSRQAFGLLPKVREVDRLLSPSWQATVYEAHPELAFAALAGRPLAASKKTRAGRQARLHLLQSAPEAWLRQLGEALAALPPLPRSQAAPDDLLDAAVLTRTAYRIATGQATCLPPAPPRDARGLRMAIWY